MSVGLGRDGGGNGVRGVTTAAFTGTANSGGGGGGGGYVGDQVSEGGDGGTGFVVFSYASAYKVTFDANEGSSISDGSFATGGSVAEPTAPTRDGFR